MKKRSAGTLRMIGGQWRHQQITFPDTPGLRPTHDRVRETLFNWLTPYIEGASCLDLFSGSGALGFEALSRGAKQVSFIDNNKPVLEALQKNAEKLGAERYEIVFGECPERMPALGFAPYDTVFLDPPFNQNLLAPSAIWLEESGYLNDEAYIYVEVEKEKAPPSLPANWLLKKEAKTSSLAYYLFFKT